MMLESFTGFRFSEFRYHGEEYFAPTYLCFMTGSASCTPVFGLGDPCRVFPDGLQFSISWQKRVLESVVNLQAALTLGLWLSRLWGQAVVL